jgi:hypothetical protein
MADFGVAQGINIGHFLLRLKGMVKFRVCWENENFLARLSSLPHAATRLGAGEPKALLCKM